MAELDISEPVAAPTFAPLAPSNPTVTEPSFEPLDISEPTPLQPALTPATEAGHQFAATQSLNADHEAKIRGLSESSGMPLQSLRGLSAADLQTLEARITLNKRADKAPFTTNAIANSPAAAVAISEPASINAVADAEQLMISAPTQEVSYIEGLVNAGANAVDTVQMGFATAESHFNLQVAKELEAGRSPTESAISGFAETLVQFTQSVANLTGFDKKAVSEWVAQSPLALLTAAQSGFARGSVNLTKEVADAPAFREIGEAALKEAIQLSKAVGNRPMSDSARSFLAYSEGLGENASFEDTALAFTKSMATNPAGFVAFMTEVVIQSGAPIVIGGAATLATRNPLVGMAIGTLGNYSQEAYRPHNDYLKKTHDLDLTTEAGFEKFVNSPSIQADVERFGATRGTIVSAFELLGIGIAGRTISKAFVIDVLVKAGMQIPTDFLGELGAEQAARGDFEWKDAFEEAAAGPITTPIDMVVAGHANRAQKQHAEAARTWLRTGEAVSDKLKNSPVGNRDMATAAEVTAEKLKSEGVEVVYLDADKLVQFNQDGDLDAISTLGLDADEVTTAATEGGFVEISAEAYVRHILGADGFEKLIEHTTTEMGGMTPSEAQYFLEQGEAELNEKMEKLSEQFKGQVGLDETEMAQAEIDLEQIRSDVFEQLNQIPNTTASQNRMYAQLTAQRYLTRALRASAATGQTVSAQDLYLEDNVRISDENIDVQTTASLEQAAIIAEAETELSKGFKDPPIPELEEAARRREAREITQAEYNKIVSRLKPVTEYRAEDLLEPATSQEMADALTENKRSRVGKGAEWLGKLVGLRLDIPAYKNNGVWVPTIHDSKGSPQAHEATAHIIGVTFTMPGDTAEKKAGRVGRGEQDKSPFAQMKGTLQSVDAATLYPQIKDLIGDPEWTQVGYDPRRHTFFYDRKTQKAVLSADEVIQVGPLVMARNVKFATRKEVFLFQDQTPEFKIKTDRYGFATVKGDPEAIRAQLPDGIRGQPTAGGKGLRFTPNLAPRVIAALRGDATAFSRGGKVVNHRKDKDGKYIGASAANNTPAKLATWRKKFKQLAVEGTKGRFWYELSGAAVLDMTGGNVAEAKKMIALLAIYSPQATVAANSTFALRAWAQYKAGEPIDTKTSTQDRQAAEVLYEGKSWGGEKTNNFYINLLRQVDQSVATKQGATIDLWMMRAGFYDHDAPSSSEYAFMENESNKLAAELGWEPQQVQAAVWVGMKARMENSNVKKETEKISKKNGWIRFDKGANGKPVRVIIDAQAHLSNWVKQGMKHTLTPADTLTAKFDFSDGIRRHIGQLSWEARPSTSSGVLANMHTATYAEQEELQLAIMGALADSTGTDRLAQALGILTDGSVVAPGVWQGDISPSTQTQAPMAIAQAGKLYYSLTDPDAAPLNKREYDEVPKADRKNYEGRASLLPAQKQTLDVYSAILGLLLRQDGVGYHKPFFGESIKRSNGVDFNIGRPLSPAETTKLNDTFSKLMTEAGFGPWSEAIGLVGAPTGIRIIAMDPTFIDNKKLHSIAKKAFTETSETDTVDIGYFASDGGFAGNNWKEAPNGENYIRTVIASERSDVLRWARDVLLPDIQSVYDDFAATKGWGSSGQLTGNGRGRTAGGRFAPLEGAPTGPAGASGPDQRLNRVAESYAASVNIDLGRQAAYVEVDEARATAIASAYEEMAHAPNDPVVAEAYQNLIEQTTAQYEALVDAGYTFRFFGNETDPYDTNPWNAMRDLRNNKTMAVYATSEGFGVGDFDPALNPLLADTGIVWDMDGTPTPVLANDLFRAVHDAFGHGLEGAGFRARGEENAWQAHAKLYTGSALRALTTETRGQNSWLNYGPHGETNRTASLFDTIFADQKTGLLPEWVSEDGTVADELTLDMAVAGVPLQQVKADIPRGQFTPSSQITDQNGNPMNLIQIFEAGDRTTFLHESGHFWLEQLKTDAARFGGQLNKDFEVVTNWWVDNSDSIRAEALDRARRSKDPAAVEAISKMSDAFVKAHIRSGDLEGAGVTRYLSVAMHEQWARGTENYFSSGEAPSVGMADMFAAFSAWITSIYKTMQKRTGRDGLDVQFSPQVKAVMDRLLASDAEIDLVASQYEVASMFTSAEEAGMTQAGFAAYQRNIGRTKANAKAKQVSKRVKEQERQRLKYWKEEIEAMRSEVEQEVAQRRAHKLVWTLAEGGLADGSTAGVLVDKINTSSLLETISQLDLERLPRAGNKAIYSNSKKSGETANATFVAQSFDYDNVKEMTDDLLATPSFKEAVSEEIDRKMEEKHGRLEDNAYEAAIASIHSTSDMAKHIATELSAIRTTEAAINTKFVKATAIARIGKMAVKDLKPQKFLAMEKKHGKAAGVAFRKGDRVEAHKHKFQQLVNHYMATEAMRRQKEVDKSREYLRPFKSKTKKYPSIDADYVDRIKILLDGVGFGTRITERARLLAELRTLNDWIIAKQTDDGAIFDVSEATLAREDEVNYRDMSLNDFEALINDVKMIERQGRLKKKLLRGVEERDRAEVIAELLTKLEGKGTAKNLSATRKRGDSKDKEGNTPFAAGVAFADTTLVKIEFLLEELDGEIMGPWYQALYQPFADAEDVKNQMNKTATDLIYRQLKALYKNEKFNLNSPVDMGLMGSITGEPKQEWTRGMLIMMVLNTGNDSNLDKLIRGEKERGRIISEEMISDLTQQLTKKEMDFIQSIWTHSETLWPEVDRINRHEYGKSPDRVAARNVETSHGTYRGGYYPMRYDTTNDKGARIEQLDALQAFQSENIRASLNSSMTKGRTAFAAPVDFDIGKLVGTFERTTHLISHYQAVRNSQRLLADPTLRAALTEALGQPYVKELDSWVGAIASNGQDRPPLSPAERLAQTLANVTTVSILGLSYTTIVSQPLGLLTGYDRLLADTTYGPVNATVAAKDMAVGAMMSMNPFHIKAVKGLSPAMRFRMDTMDRDIRAARRSLRAQSGIIPRIGELSMLVIGATQFYIVDMPTWTAAFNRALRAEPGDQKKAIQYADRVVRISQTAGSIKDLSSIQRHKGFAKLLVLFHSYFSLLYSIIRQRGKSITVRNPSTIINFTVSMFILLTMTAFAEAILKRQEIPDLNPDEEDEQGMLAWAAERSLNTAAMSVPVAGSGADVLIGKLTGSSKKPFGFSLSPVDLLGKTFSEGLGSTADMIHFGWNEAVGSEQTFEVGADEANNIAAMVLFLKRLPVIQPKRVVDALIAKSEEAEDWSILDLLTGYDEDRAKE